MEKTTIILIDILMLFSLCMCILSFSIKDIVIGAISQEEVGVQASRYLMDSIVEEFPDENIDILMSVQNDLAKSSSLESITSKYIDALQTYTISFVNQGNSTTNMLI